MRDIDPDSEENQAAQRQTDREIFALKMQAKYPNGITDDEVKLYDEISADLEQLRRQPAFKFVCDRHLGDPALDHAVPCLACLIDEEREALRVSNDLQEQFSAASDKYLAERDNAEKERDACANAYVAARKDLHASCSEVSRLLVELAEAKASADDSEQQFEHERAERQKEVGAQEYRGNTVNYIYYKLANYGVQFDKLRQSVVALTLAVEAHCAGREVPPDIAALCPRVAEMLNGRMKAQTDDEIRATEEGFDLPTA